MAFTELNSVEYFIIRQFTGINLNQVQHGMVKENAVPYGENAKWKYVQSELLPRDITDVFLEKELKESLIRLNPAIKLPLSSVATVLGKTDGATRVQNRRLIHF
jgi:type I restriction enzyme R subunit